ncbi:uncharacterized protein [Miscanthus floridulus]|uniref:uncharacterized protein isoform X2 n=1 Tax=Miscanthus floridulus TaxID=154761 RepID=UPI003457A32D
MRHLCGVLPLGHRRRGRYLPHPPCRRDLGTRCARDGNGIAGPAATAWPVSYGRGSWPPPSRTYQSAQEAPCECWHHWVNMQIYSGNRPLLLGVFHGCAGPACSRCSGSTPPPSATACSGPKGALLFVLASDRFRFSSVMQSPPSTR